MKFQFSAKFDVWPNEGRHAVYFAFTERVRWELYKPSSPIPEQNLSPELFYTFYHHAKRYEPEPGCAFFRERAGVQHESNGEGDETSRGWNRLFVSSRFACYSEERFFGLAELKAWAPPVFIRSNPDISRFYGYGELTMSFGHDGTSGWPGEFDLTTTLRKGTRDWGTGSVELDAQYGPPLGEHFRFTPKLYVQLFHGFGETLLRYDEVVTAFRVGISFSDRATRAR